MADPNPPAPAPAKVITSDAGKPVDAVAQKKVGETDDDIVQVKALKPYLGNEDKRSVGLPGHVDNNAYPVSRRRAVELRSHGLADYVNDTDHGREVEDAAKQAGDAVRKKYEVKR